MTPAQEPASHRPVARVAVDVWLPHLDRLFDYQVPASMDADAQPGVRVRVRFAGRLVDGFLIERADHTEVTGRLASLNRVVSPEVVMTPHQVGLIREVADHYAGTFADVARLAVPPRHAATEKAERRAWPVPTPGDGAAGPLSDVPGGAGFLEALTRGDAPRAFWQVPPALGPGPCARWIAGIVQAVEATLRGGRGAAVVVPDLRDVKAMVSALQEALGGRCVAVLHSGLGPAARYRNYLAVVRGEARVVVGTRPAAFAPVRDLGLMVVWDDGDPLHEEIRAPHQHVRTVAALRAGREKVALLLAAHSRSCEVQDWVERRWLAPLALPVPDQRRTAPAVRASADSDQELERDPLADRVRMPSMAFAAIRDGLLRGPVLVQVPRAGYRAGLRCSGCGEQVRCARCNGPLRPTGTPAGRDGQVLACAWCGATTATWSCPTCSGRRWWAPVVGSSRTREELGRAFPGVVTVDSSGERIVDEVDQTALVVATPGAEPTAVGGYAAAVLLDAPLLLDRPELRAAEEALRRWLNAVSLVRGGPDEGRVVIVGPSGDRAVQALVRSDPAGFAARELEDRREAWFPPAVRLAQVDGTRDAVAFLLDHLAVPDEAQVLGPVERDEDVWRVTLRAQLGPGRGLAPAIKAVQALASAQRTGLALGVRIDPVAVQ